MSGALLCGGLTGCGGADPLPGERADLDNTEQQKLGPRLRYDPLPDVGEFVVDGRKWGTTNLSYFFQNGTSDISGTGEETAIRKALSFWEAVSPVRFTRAASASAADIVVSFATGDHGDGYPFDGPFGILAHTFSPPPNGGALAGDAHFDDAETWIDQERASEDQPIDLVTVAAHELGHALGLAHSSSPSALMYPFYAQSQRFLGVDDIAGVQQLYGTGSHPEATAAYGRAVAMGDFNRDGFDDLAIGVPGQTVAGGAAAGAVVVQYGSAGASPALQVITQDSFNISGASEAGDRFGNALAAGDFDGDGSDDLAIGAPGEGIGSSDHAGAVNIVYGSASGLNYVNNQVLNQGNGGVHGTPLANDRFGTSLAVGDFNHDGLDDLVVGVPGESIGSASQAGAIHVMPGSTSGVAPANELFLYQGNAGVSGTSAADDAFGGSLATGDLNGDGLDDLVVGVPGKDTSAKDSAGAIHVFFGAIQLITTTGNFELHQDSPGIAGGAEANDKFGSSIACGDFNGDGFDDIAVGVPGEAVGSAVRAGTVNFIFGSPSGPTSVGNYYLHEDSANVPGAAGTEDLFGSSLASGDFNGDGFDDVAVGVPGETVAGFSFAGVVYVFRGATNGPNGITSAVLSQDVAGVAGAPESNDEFGYGLAAGDFNGDGRDDLGVGVVNETIDTATGAGAAHVLFGASTGITSTGSLLFTE